MSEAVEDLKGEGRPAEGLEHASDMKLAQTEEGLDHGHFHHPDVVDEASHDGFLRPGGRHGRGWRRRFLHETADGSRGQLPAGTGEHGGDHVLPAAAEASHGLSQVADDVGQAPDGRSRFDCGTHCSRVRAGVTLPIEDGVGTHEEDVRGLFHAPAEQLLSSRMRKREFGT